jgi:hypothetical protein
MERISPIAARSRRIISLAMKEIMKVEQIMLSIGSMGRG